MEKRISVSLIVALAILIAMPASSMAQDRETQDPYRNMVTTVTNTNMHLQNLNAHEDLRADRIRYVDANELLTDDNRTEFDETLQRHHADTRALRDAINRNEIMTGSLDQHQVRVDNVIGVNVADDGWLTVYHHRPMR